MSWIGNNLLNSPFSGFPAQSTATQPGTFTSNPAPSLQSDAMIVGFPGAGSGVPANGLNGSATSNGLSAMMNGFASYVNSLFSQIASWYGGNGTSTSSYGNQNAATAANGQGAACQTNGGQCTPGSSAQKQAFFTNASASSWGDPHDTFSGSSSGSGSVNQSWDNMHSHADLLDSNSFAGGYRVSTQVTQPNAQGVTMNQSATVTAGGGNTVVSLDASGQYQISSYGNNVTLQSGQTAQLGGGEAVTLNNDGSLTVTDSNSSRGQISTTLRANGNGGVDVKAQASDVDLGGYLVSHADGPTAQQPRQPVWRVEPAASQSPRPASPFDEIDQVAN
jgi:hypothetical protein